MPGVCLLLMDGRGILTCLLFVANSLVLAIVGAGRVCEVTHVRDWLLPWFLRYIYPLNQKAERGIPVIISCTGCEPTVYSKGPDVEAPGKVMGGRGSWFGRKDTTTDGWVLRHLLLFSGYQELLLLYNLVRGIKSFTYSGSCLGLLSEFINWVLRRTLKSEGWIAPHRNKALVLCTVLFSSSVGLPLLSKSYHYVQKL